MPYEIEDFMPSRAKMVRNGRAHPAHQTIEEQIEMCKLFTEAMSMPQKRLAPRG
jgi:hypothetical protein